jgi:hypothetical protein
MSLSSLARSFFRPLKRLLWWFGLVFVGAVSGIPIAIDPPPRERVEDPWDQTGARRKNRRRRAA